jgi:hypothetical protein
MRGVVPDWIPENLVSVGDLLLRTVSMMSNPFMSGTAVKARTQKWRRREHQSDGRKVKG